MISTAQRVGHSNTIPDARNRWSWAQYLALIGLPILLVEVWTVTAWLIDGPYQITEFRSRDSINWYAARVYEVLGVGLALSVGTRVVRACLRQRRATFDALFVLAGMTLFWADASLNFYQPILLMSSNFVNLNNPLGHLPFAVNPDLGRMPEPLLFTIPLESFGLLAGAMALGKAAEVVRRRRPGISTAKLVGLLFCIAVLLELLLEVPAIALGLWTYTLPEAMSLPLGRGFRLPMAEILATALWFLCCALLRNFKDDRGRTLVERGLERYNKLQRTAICFLAVYGSLQLISWIPAVLPVVAVGPYQNEWPKYPAYVLNGMCDVPGTTGTRYGPCPGSPDFRTPGRATRLPGDAP